MKTRRHIVTVRPATMLVSSRLFLNSCTSALYVVVSRPCRWRADGVALRILLEWGFRETIKRHSKRLRVRQANRPGWLPDHDSDVCFLVASVIFCDFSYKYLILQKYWASCTGLEKMSFLQHGGRCIYNQVVGESRHDKKWHLLSRLRKNYASIPVCECALETNIKNENILCTNKSFIDTNCHF